VIVLDLPYLAGLPGRTASAGEIRTLVVTNPDYGKGTCLGCAKVT